MDIYHYHPATNEFIGTSEARLDPLETQKRGENVYLLPACATHLEPPVPGANEVAVFGDNMWSVTPDFRGTTYWLSDGSEHVINELGIPMPNDALREKPTPPDTISEPTQADYEGAIQAMLDEAAKTKLYADGTSLATYTNSTNAQWASEAERFIAWRDAVWSYAYEQLAAVQAGERSQPTVEDILDELPQLTWPN